MESDLPHEARPRLGESTTLEEGLAAIAASAAAGTRADAVVVRLADGDGATLPARAVWGASAALAAELEGSSTSLPDRAAAGDADETSHGLRRLADRLRLNALVAASVVVDGRVVGSVEAMRHERPFGPDDEGVVRLAADQVALVLRAFRSEDGNGATGSPLDVAGDALAAATEEGAADQVARLAAQTTGALGCLLWSPDAAGGTASVAAYGLAELASGVARERATAVATAAESRPVAVDRVSLTAGPSEAVLVSVRLGEPLVGVLQLVFGPESEPSEQELTRLATFGVRAAHALRAREEATYVALELERTRALLAVVGQAIAELSLAHALETATARVGELLGVDRVAVYLREDDGLEVAAERGLVGPHALVGDSLLRIALGPLRGHGLVTIADAARDSRLAIAADAVAEAGVEAALAVPLLAHEEAIGLLAIYPAAGRSLSANESRLLSALAAQLAVAVQNARLHERAKQLGAELEQVLTSERQAARQLAALYEISRSFTESLSLETTLEAVARTVVESMPVDAAVIAMHDRPRETLVTRAVHVAEARNEPAVRTILSTAHLAELGARLKPGAPPLLLGRRAPRPGGAHELLAPFLEKGATAAVVPVATPAELLATLTLLSLDPARPLTPAAAGEAAAIARQAALAIDNARLYQQQKDFAETMQRSLLPRTRPDVDGLEIGHVYESPERADVGGDVYDFLELGDSRLAVVVGDVTGHGIEAAADMALAKFAFRSLAREHPEPGDFLAAVNEVAVGELAPAKFITMTYVAIDVATGRVACACAGHPPPRLVRPDGSIVPLAASGLALGIERRQSFVEVEEALEPGSLIVLYTDGVLEARRGDELYGFERLDRFLAEHHSLPADELARAVLADCRAFAGGELGDDCAVVAVRRPS